MLFRKTNRSDEKIRQSCLINIQHIDYIIEDALNFWGDALQRAFCILHGKIAIAGQLYIKDGSKKIFDGIPQAVCWCFPVCEECIEQSTMIDNIEKHLVAREMVPCTIVASDDFIRGMISTNPRAVKFAIDNSPYRGDNLAKAAKLRVNTALN